MTQKKSRTRWTAVFLVVLPLWLILSASVGIWLLFRHERKQEEQEQARFSHAVSIPLLSDDLKKIVTLIGERNPSSAASAANLSRMASMIEGLLGPSNTGYTVRKHRGPSEWPILQVSVAGKSGHDPLWIVTSYDSPAGSRGAEANATGLAATLAAAQAVAADKPARTIHFTFTPHANDPDSPVVEGARILSSLLRQPAPSALLVVEAMGGGEALWLTSRDTAATPLDHAGSLGEVIGAEVACLGEDSDLASVLFEMGFPAVRVSTRPIVLTNEPDDREPFAPTVAASSGRLVELIRRLAK